MKSLYGIVLLLSAITLQAFAESNTPPSNGSSVEVRTFSQSCYGQANGSAAVHTAGTNWNLEVYRNGTLLRTLAVAGTDTVMSNLELGAYTFIYRSHNGASDTITKIISAPSRIISECRVHYLTRPGQNAVSFINLSSGAVKFDWSFGDGEHSAEISPEHNYAKAGTYTVTLTAYNVNGCSSASTYTVVVGTNETGVIITPLPSQVREPVYTTVH